MQSFLIFGEDFRNDSREFRNKVRFSNTKSRESRDGKGICSIGMVLAVYSQWRVRRFGKSDAVVGGFERILSDSSSGWLKSSIDRMRRV